MSDEARALEREREREEEPHLGSSRRPPLGHVDELPLRPDGTGRLI